MAKVPKGRTIYTRGKTYKQGQEAPDELLGKELPKPAPKAKEPKKDK